MGVFLVGDCRRLLRLARGQPRAPCLTCATAYKAWVTCITPYEASSPQARRRFILGCCSRRLPNLGPLSRTSAPSPDAAVASTPSEWITAVLNKAFRLEQGSSRSPESDRLTCARSLKHWLRIWEGGQLAHEDGARLTAEVHDSSVRGRRSQAAQQFLRAVCSRESNRIRCRPRCQCLSPAQPE